MSVALDQPPPEGARLRRSDQTERFVAFAFAAADLVAEIDAEGRITFAAGAFRARLGQGPEVWVGRNVRRMIDAHDHCVLDAALMLLFGKGRLPPVLLRLTDKERTTMALGGLVLAPAGCAKRFCLTFAIPPAPAIEDAPQDLARATSARLRSGEACDIGLIELVSKDVSAAAGERLQSALQAVDPHAKASELGPGRFGLLATQGPAALLATIASLEAALDALGDGTLIKTRQLSTNEADMASSMAARVLKQALSVFARDGSDGLDKAGFKGGLAGYLSQAASHADAILDAIKARRFELDFQPIVSLADRSVHHYEALLRPKPILRCPFKSVQEFVLLVETLGLADELDLAVAEVASENAKDCIAPIAFNVSAQSVQNPKFRERLIALLSDHPATLAGRLIVEMTETSEMENLDEAEKTAQALRQIGVPFCLDDFGAGMADVRVLRAVPADVVKLDGSYMGRVAHKGREQNIVAGMVDIAHGAGATVVAEWVETEAQAASLHSMGVAYGQGWLFGRAGAIPKAMRETGSRPRPLINARRGGERKDSWG